MVVEVFERVVPLQGGGWRPAPDALTAYVESARPWAREQVPLPVDVTAVLWTIVVANVLLEGWAVAVLTGVRRCDGFLCSLTTLGGRPWLLLVLSGCCLLSLVSAAAVTGGLTRAGGGQLAVLVVAALTGVGAVLGVVLAFLTVVVTIALVGGLVVALFQRV
jgi:hypothetical protein